MQARMGDTRDSEIAGTEKLLFELSLESYEEKNENCAESTDSDDDSDPEIPSNYHLGVPQRRPRGFLDTGLLSTSAPSSNLHSSFIFNSRSTFSIRVHTNEDTYDVVDILKDATAAEVCKTITFKNRYPEHGAWCLIEYFRKHCVERMMEDHESVMKVHDAWPRTHHHNKLYLRKNFTKYQMFEEPSQFFPGESSIKTRKIFLQNLLDNPTWLPELQGWLYFRDKRSWKWVYCFLRKSGMYYSSKDTNSSPRHLQCCLSYSNNAVYLILPKGKKSYNCPTDFCFAVRPSKYCSTVKLICFAAANEKSRQSWVSGLRLAIYGEQLRINYLSSEQMVSKRRTMSTDTHGLAPNAGGRTLVAMDFTGQTGRVVSNPGEEIAIAKSEGMDWKRKLRNRTISNDLHLEPHVTHGWFHPGISREIAHNILVEHGHADGAFLVRESNSQVGTYVLSVYFESRIRHLQVAVANPNDDRSSLSVDGGMTKFSDLEQLVDFYSLNKGSLPCVLSRPCIKR